MVSVLDNQEGFLTGYIEWYVLNEHGQFQENGDYIYIHEIWIHPLQRKKKALKHLIQKIDKDPLGYTAKWVYWSREKYNRLTRPFPRERLAKIGANYGF